MRLPRPSQVVLVLVLALAVPSAGHAREALGPIVHTARYHDDFDDDNDELWLLAAAGVIAGVTFAAPVWVPYSMIDQGKDGPMSFSEYPYENGYPGFMSDGFDERSSNQAFSLRAGVEYGVDFNDVNTVGGKLAIDFLYRLGLDAGWTSYFERDGSGGTDDFSVGDVNLVARFVEHPQTIWRVGVGVNWLADSGGEAGFNFTYGIDYFPIRPVVWSLELDWGCLASDPLVRLRSTLGLQLRDFEVYTGVEYLDIREEEFTTMLFGVRYWW